MILATHIVIASAVSQPVFQNPGLVFLFALVSHYALDAIPHWEYRIKSVKKDKNNSMLNATFFPDKKLFVNDLLKMALDASIGLLIVLFLTQPFLNWQSILSIIALATGALLPDFITGLNLFWRKFPTLELVKFQNLVQSNVKRLENKPFQGIGLQIIIALVFLLIFH